MLVVRDGVVEPEDRRQQGRVLCRALGGRRKFSLKVDPAARLKDPKDYTIVGKSVARLDIPAKIFGTLRLRAGCEGAGHAACARGASGRRPGDTPSLERFACRKIQGYVRAVRKGDFLAVVATNEWAAISASTAIVAKWSDWAGLPDESQLFEYVRDSKVDRSEVLQSAGDTAEAMKAGRPEAAGDLRLRDEHARLDRAIVRRRGLQGRPAHGLDAVAGEPSAAQAARHHAADEAGERSLHLRRGRGLLWPQRLRRLLVGGSADREGNRPAGPAAVDARRTSTAGTRKGRRSLLDYRASVDDQGRIAAGNRTYSCRSGRCGARASTLLAAALAEPAEVRTRRRAGCTTSGLGIPYALAEQQIDRALARRDAAAGGVDSRAGAHAEHLRQRELSRRDRCRDGRRSVRDPAAQSQRSARARTAASVCGSSRSGSRGARAARHRRIARGRGVSYAKYELVRTYVGVVADVTVDRTTGKVKVDRVFVVHDCGQIINPDGLRNQIEGNVVQTVSRTLIEKLTFSRSAVTSLDWGSYPILTFPDVPEVAIDLIDRPTEVPWGAGEPTTSVVPSAIANAVFDATGARLRSVPFRPDTVLAALSARSPDSRMAPCRQSMTMRDRRRSSCGPRLGSLPRENVAFHGAQDEVRRIVAMGPRGAMALPDGRWRC